MEKNIMRHVLKKKAKSGVYTSIHQKIARQHSGDTITAKAFLKKLDKEKEHGTKSSKEI